MRSSKGFSIIELLVIVAIVALLAAVAIPSYRDYTHKTKMAQVNSLINRQLDIWAEKNSLGTTETIVEASPDPYISSITLTFPSQNHGSVVAILNEQTLTFLPPETTVTYTPAVANNVVTWSCEYTSAGTTNLSTYFQGTNCTCRDCKAE